MKIRIPTRTSPILIISFAILTLLFGFGDINSMISYKYQVQDFQQAGKPAFYGLDDEQLSTLHRIILCKCASNSCFVLLVFALIMNEREPTFNGRVSYESKDEIN
jgi:hypothetical protein